MKLSAIQKVLGLVNARESLKGEIHAVETGSIHVGVLTACFGTAFNYDDGEMAAAVRDVVAEQLRQRLAKVTHDLIAAGVEIDA